MRYPIAVPALLCVVACRVFGVPMAGTSFERSADLEHFAGKGFHATADRAQFGTHSLAWSFGAGQCLEVADLRSLSLEESGIRADNPFPSSPAFVMSVYNADPIRGSLRVEFNERVHFDLNLGFKGWRTVWVPFHEMQGRAPRPGRPFQVATVRFVAPSSAGTLWFDDLVFSQYVDDRYPYPGLEVPFIKGGGVGRRDHWMPKPSSWSMLEQLSIPKSTHAQRSDFIKVSDRLWLDLFRQSPRILGVGFFRGAFDFGKPLKFRGQVEPIRYRLSLGGDPDYFRLSDFGKVMFFLAREYNTTREEALAELFARATEYYLEQGWVAGSAQGTTFRLGYCTRELYTSFFLMQPVLEKKGLMGAVGDSMRWQLDFGGVLDSAQLESNLDYYRTQSAGQMMSVFLAPGLDRQVAYLSAYADHLSAALALADGEGGFKPDGTAWHHHGHYPAYAAGAFERLATTIHALSGTSFCIRKAGHANLKRAFLAATIYSNPFYWGLGQAGRFPLGGGIERLKTACLALALSGTPDGSEAIDPDVAAAYVRLWGEPEEREFAGLQLDTAAPTGHWTFPYAALSVHRRDNWSVNIKGYSRNVWASEIYRFANRYGRYPSNGTVQILPDMPPEKAGYTQDGWDWNHPPGATTIERPFAELEPRGPLAVFKSRETYAGGCDLDGDGVWAMKLNEGGGYSIGPEKRRMSFPGRLKARKSVFCFGRQLLCLGSGIRSDDPSAPVHTTLFQNGIRKVGDAVYANGKGLLLDPLGSGYRILDGSKVVVVEGSQSSPNDTYSLRAGKGKKGASASASGLFAKAWIDHGPAPKGAGYAYSVFPMTGTTNFPALEEYIAGLSRLEILRRDDRAHVVLDAGNGTVAYACFEAGKVGPGRLLAVSAPCFAMIRPVPESEMLEIAVANPDLNQRYNVETGNYEGPSRETVVELKLSGNWKIHGTARAGAEPDGDQTRLRVRCIDGKSVRVEVEPVAAPPSLPANSAAP